MITKLKDIITTLLVGYSTFRIYVFLMEYYNVLFIAAELLWCRRFSYQVTDTARFSDHSIWEL